MQPLKLEERLDGRTFLFFFFFASPLSVKFVRPGTVDATPKLELVRFLSERRTR